MALSAGARTISGPLRCFNSHRQRRGARKLRAFCPKRRSPTVQCRIGQSARDTAVYESQESPSVLLILHDSAATFNGRGPSRAGKYFNKIQCFCLTGADGCSPGRKWSLMPVLLLGCRSQRGLDDPNMK